MNCFGSFSPLMSITLATTFNQRGETGRLMRLYPQCEAVYSHHIISLPLTAAAKAVERIQSLPRMQVSCHNDWSHGRFTALQAAYETGADYIHYVDMDRLIRWVETRPGEWHQTLERIPTCDCLITGRTEAAWATHPQVMIQVE